MDIKIANTLFDNGTLSEMYKSGLLSDKIFIYREIFLWVNAQIYTRCISKNAAVLEAEIKFKKDERTIWRAMNSFSK